MTNQTAPAAIAGAGRGQRWDGGFIAALFAPFALLVLTAGQRLGEPVADDYDYLHHLLLTPSWSWFDGGGATVYWRPLARQAWFALIGPSILEHPRAVAFVQLACICAASGLLYGAFRRLIGPLGAFAVSTAPWMMESSRLLIAWPSGFQDTGVLLFTALALHEAASERRWSFVLAGIAALLCKEVAAVALLTVGVCPLVRPGTRRTWFVTSGVLTAAWAMVAVAVHVRAGLSAPATPPTGFAALRALGEVAWWSARALFSLTPGAGVADLLVVLTALALIPWKRLAAAGAHDRELRHWWAWGLAWSAPLMLTLVPFHPAWAPYRIPFVGFGMLAALIVTLTRVHRYAIPVFLASRLVLMGMAPGPVRYVSVDPPFHGASIDVPRLSRLQRLTGDARHVLTAAHPTLPAGATVVWENFPGLTEFAFGTQPALQVWYRDPTLRWSSVGPWAADSSAGAAAVVEFEPNQDPAVALVEPRAMRALLNGTAALRSKDWPASIAWLDRAESLQTDHGLWCSSRPSRASAPTPAPPLRERRAGTQSRELCSSNCWPSTRMTFRAPTCWNRSSERRGRPGTARLRTRMSAACRAGTEGRSRSCQQERAWYVVLAGLPQRPVRCRLFSPAIP